MAFRGTGKQMWNSAITERGAGSGVGSNKTTYTRKMAKFTSTVANALSPVVLIPLYIVVMSRDAASPDKPIFTEWFVDMSKPALKSLS